MFTLLKYLQCVENIPRCLKEEEHSNKFHENGP